MVRPSCGREIITMSAVDAMALHWYQAIRDSCGCSNESFTTMEHISIMWCNLCCHLQTWIGLDQNKDFIFVIDM